jgi:hypothetical protein
MELDGANRNGEGGVWPAEPPSSRVHVATSLIAHASRRRLSAISIPVLARNSLLEDDTVDTTTFVQHELCPATLPLAC